MPVVVNLGGEGEEIGVINVNAFIEATMIDPRFDTRFPAAQVVRASAHKTGLAGSSVDLVIANGFPIQFDELVIDNAGTRVSITLLAAEVFRILKPGGHVAFSCSSCDRQSLAAAFEQAGIRDVTILQNGQVNGRKA